MKVIRKSILAKILLGIVVPVILSLIILLSMVLNTVKNEETFLTTESLTAKSKEASYQVDGFFTQYLTIVDTLSKDPEMEAFFKTIQQGVPILQAEGFAPIKTNLINVAALDSENILAIWIVDFDTSQLTQSDGFTSGADWDVTTRGWYQTLTAQKKTIITEPYIDTSSKSLVVSAVAPVYDSATNQMIGAVGLDLTLEKLNEIMASYKFGEEGFFRFISNDGQIIYDKTKEDIMKNITEIGLSSEIMDLFKNKKEAFTSYERDGKTYYGAFSLIGDTGWSILSAMPESEYYLTYNEIARASIILVIIIALVLSGFIAFIARGLIKPLKRLAKAADQIADGNLEVEMENKSIDETGQVAAAFERTVVRLKDYVKYIDEISEVLDQIAMGNIAFDLKYDYAGGFAKIKMSLLNIQKSFTETLMNILVSADQVANGSSQLANGSQALSQGAMEQASSIEELSATINEITNHIKQNAENALHASSLAEEASKEVEHGSSQMKDMIEAMEKIRSASNEIGKIIKTIDDIAFQTNILALNAAVEAARAGAAGKGFAVVADEVRNLAGKSAEAAKNTTSLIESAIGAVENGTQIVDKTAQSLTKIVDGSKQTTELINQISQATNDQATAMTQATMGISQISDVVQTNSATAEESAATSEELSGQAHMLQELVSHFKLEKHDHFDFEQEMPEMKEKDKESGRDEFISREWDSKY